MTVSDRELFAVALRMTIEKADLVISWMADGIVSLHFDARRDDVKVPGHLRGEANCAFEIGFDMPVPIPNLKVTQDGFSGTLSFGGYGMKWCFVPWPAVFCVGQRIYDRARVWLNDAPAEVQREVLQRAGEAANKKLARSRLRLVK